jgi:hypothetical protein
VDDVCGRKGRVWVQVTLAEDSCGGIAEAAPREEVAHRSNAYRLERDVPHVEDVVPGEEVADVEPVGQPLPRLEVPRGREVAANDEDA